MAEILRETFDGPIGLPLTGTALEAPTGVHWQYQIQPPYSEWNYPRVLFLNGGVSTTDDLGSDHSGWFFKNTAPITLPDSWEMSVGLLLPTAGNLAGWASNTRFKLSIDLTGWFGFGLLLGTSSTSNNDIDQVAVFADFNSTVFTPYTPTSDGAAVLTVTCANRAISATLKWVSGGADVVTVLPGDAIGAAADTTLTLGVYHHLITVTSLLVTDKGLAPYSGPPYIGDPRPSVSPPGGSVPPVVVPPTAPTGRVEEAPMVWPWAPNWAQPVVERLSWATSIHSSRQSYEQRRALRTEPRLEIGMSHLLQQRQAARMVSLIRAWAGRPWAVPAWWAKANLVSVVGTLITIDRPVETLWFPGMRGLIWTDEDTFEPFTVSNVAGTTITLLNALAATPAPGSLVLPLHSADLPADQIATAPVAGVVLADVQFAVRPGSAQVLRAPVDGSDWPIVFPATASATEPRNHYLPDTHNWIDAARLTTSLPTDSFDTTVGLAHFRAEQTVANTTWAHRLLLNGDASLMQFRKWLAARRGRAVAFHAAPLMVDVSIEGSSPGQFVAPILSLYANPWELFRGVDVNGQVYAIQQIALGVVTLYDPSVMIPAGAKVRMISRCRLASDTIEIQHHRPGLAEATIALQSVRWQQSSVPANTVTVLGEYVTVFGEYVTVTA